MITTTVRNHLEEQEERSETPMSGPTVFGIRAWWLYAGVSLLLMVGFLTVLTPARDLVYPAFTLLSAAVFAIGIRKMRPDRAIVFWIFCTGTVLQGFGDIVWFRYVDVGMEIPYPSVADYLYIASYVFWIVAVAVLVFGRRASRDLGGWIDTAIAIVAVGLAEYVFFIHPYLTSPDTSLMSRSMSAAYPIADLLMLGVLARLLVSPGARTAAFRLFLAGFAFFITTDVIYAVLVQNGTYATGLIDVGWMMGYALFALTALHPSVRTLARPLPDLKPRLSTRRLAVLAGLALVGPGLFAYEGPSKLEASVFSAIVIGTGALFLLVIARMAGLVRRLAGSMSELEAGQVARVALTRRTLWVSESERNQLASELHDGPVQQLTALSYRVQSLRGKVEKDGKQAVEGFKAVQQALSSEIVDLRRLMASLRPGALVERGLEATVGDHLATALQGTGIASRLTVTLPCRPEPEVETVVYRVIQEAISDAVEGRANEIQISLGESGGQLHLLITDDGSGLEAADDGPDTLTVSLEGLRERIEIIGGTFNVTSTPGDGTTLEAYVPMGGIT